ncbi:hypothetical protein CPC08DRAFT_754744 [Agrocybe pediades]|nr:hypothetical protein CPC08DRAFT_754744 [Agrocybe pediades]
MANKHTTRKQTALASSIRDPTPPTDSELQLTDDLGNVIIGKGHLKPTDQPAEVTTSKSKPGLRLLGPRLRSGDALPADDEQTPFAKRSRDDFSPTKRNHGGPVKRRISGDGVTVQKTMADDVEMSEASDYGSDDTEKGLLRNSSEPPIARELFPPPPPTLEYVDEPPLAQPRLQTPTPLGDLGGPANSQQTPLASLVAFAAEATPLAHQASPPLAVSSPKPAHELPQPLDASPLTAAGITDEEMAEIMRVVKIHNDRPRPLRDDRPRIKPLGRTAPFPASAPPRVTAASAPPAATTSFVPPKQPLEYWQRKMMYEESRRGKTYNINLPADPPSPSPPSSKAVLAKKTKAVLEADPNIPSDPEERLAYVRAVCESIRDQEKVEATEKLYRSLAANEMNAMDVDGALGSYHTSPTRRYSRTPQLAATPPQVPTIPVFPPPAEFTPPAALRAQRPPKGGYPELQGLCLKNLVRNVVFGERLLEDRKFAKGCTVTVFRPTETLASAQNPDVPEKLRDDFEALFPWNQEIAIFPPRYRVERGLGHGAFPFFVSGLQPAEYEWCIEQGALITPDATYFMKPAAPFTTGYLMTLRRFTISPRVEDAEWIVNQIVKRVWLETPAIRDFLMKNRSAVPEEISKEGAVDWVVDSICVDKYIIQQKGGRKDLTAYNIYANYPTQDLVEVEKWKNRVKSLSYGSEYGAGEAFEPPSCHNCYALDHPTDRCAYLEIPMFNAGREAPEVEEQEDRPPQGFTSQGNGNRGGGSRGGRGGYRGYTPGGRGPTY